MQTLLVEVLTVCMISVEMYICMHKQIVSMAQLCDGITDQVQSNGRGIGVSL